jgi:hypothetical protein
LGFDGDKNWLITFNSYAFSLEDVGIGNNPFMVLWGKVEWGNFGMYMIVLFTKG